MKNLGIISVSLFVISLLVYVAWFFNENLFSAPAIIVIVIVLPLIGLIGAFFSKKNSLKVVGIAGNLLVLVFSVIIPLTSTLFWNHP